VIIYPEFHDAKDLELLSKWIKGLLSSGKHAVLVTKSEIDHYGFDKVDTIYSSYIYAFCNNKGKLEVIGENSLPLLFNASLIVFVEGQPHYELKNLLWRLETPVLHITKYEQFLHKNFANYLDDKKLFDKNNFDSMNEWVELMESQGTMYKSKKTISRESIVKINRKNWRWKRYDDEDIRKTSSSRIKKCLKKHYYKRKA